jgi:hypothetical protein
MRPDPFARLDAKLLAQMVGRCEDIAQSTDGFQHAKMAHRRF